MSDKKEGTAAEAAPAKKVKIKVLRDCMVDGQIKLPGTICETTEDEAKMLCDTKFRGYHPFYGTMPEIGPLMGSDASGEALPNPLARKQIARAVRVA